MTLPRLGALLLLIPAPAAFAQTALGPIDKPPLEAHSTLDGQDAMAAHIGTLGFQDGVGLSYRHIGPPRGGDTDAFLGAWAPISYVTLGGGIQYIRAPGDLRYVQGSVGLAVRPWVGLSLAIAYKPFIGLGALNGAALNAWDIGLGYRPARWLSLTAGVESFNNPVHPTTLGTSFMLARTYALGAAFRPFRGDLLSIGADLRLRETLDLSQWPAPRFTLDIRPVPWLGLLLSGTTLGEIFAGITIREQHVDIGGGVGVARDQGVSNSYAFARFTSQAREGLDFTGKKTVQLGLKGDLRPEDSWSLFRLMAPQYGEIPLELYALAERNDIAGVRLVFQGFDCNFATLHEIRDAITYLRKHGKRVVAELGDSDDRNLYVASAADSIVIEPEASLAFNGIKVSLRTYKGTLDKLGVRVDAETSGEYKNSPDAFTKDAPGKEQLEVQNALLDTYYEAVVGAVARGRNLTRDKVEAAIKKGLFTGAQAKAAGLVDELARDPDPKAPPPGSRYDNLVNVGSTRIARDEWNEPPAIALIQIHGTIAGGSSFEDPFGLFPIAGAGSIVRALEEARNDSNVKAVVVRINSPGGDILASDFIWQAMRRIKGQKPLIVSMGDMAASGGYYAALPADVIFAEPETVTGSIGVFTFKIDLSGLLDKIGLKVTTLKRGEHADLFDYTRPLSDEEKKLMHDFVMEEYQAFLTKVAFARNMSVADADKVARGRVWSGAAAFDHHLVDKLGGLVDAINEAKKRAGYDTAAIMNIAPLPALGAPLGQFAAEARAALFGTARAAKAWDFAELPAWLERVKSTLSARAMYLYPYRVVAE